MQLRPLHLSLGPGLVRDTRSKFLLKLSWNILNQVELWSFMETWPNMAHVPPRLWKYTARHSKQFAINALHFLKVDQAQIRLLKCYMATLWSLTPRFVACLEEVESHNFAKHLLKLQTFPRRISSRNIFWSAPSWRDRISDPASCLRGPGPSPFLASNAAPLDSRNSAASTWPLYAARRSGVLPQALSPGSRRLPWLRGLGEEADFAETTKDVGSWVPPVQPTVSDSPSSKLFKANFTHKQKEQVSMHLSCKWHCLWWREM